MSVPSSTFTESATLLIVDSDLEVCRSLRGMFEGEGYHVVTATDASAALRVLHQAGCDLVVLEMEMPGVDGLALCRLLRAQAKTEHLPIILMSAHDSEERQVEAFTAGADDFVTKLSAPRELLVRAGAHLEATKRERALVGSNRELSFLSDLGRGLLCTLEPLQVARRVAGATYEGANPALCAAVIWLGATPPVACVFDREGVAEGDSLVRLERLEAWLKRGPTASIRVESPEQFLLRDATHSVEYIAPLRFGTQSLGALIVAYDKPEECAETESRMVDAAAQLAALAAHISSIYETTRLSSITLAKEVERRTAEVEAQRRFTEAIIDSLPVSLHVIDRDYRIVAWNRNRELGGQGVPRGKALGRSIFDVLTRQPRPLLEQEFGRVFLTGEIERIEQENTAPDGARRHWMISKIPMRTGAEDISHVITVGEEITARVEANRAVARTEKLAAVGRLAAGVVHEINNPLATIAACAEALESRVVVGSFDASPEVSDLREYLALIRSEAFRCKTITNGLLDFSRARAGQHAPVDLSELLDSVARLVRHQRRGKNIEILVAAAAGLALVSGDRGQLQQAVIILSENAIDAMPVGGALNLRARKQGGTSVAVEVSDTGVGIPLENRAKIFDPFFTTKEVGAGTGLGLAVAYGIVAEHQGHIGVESTVERGTTFTITLPIISHNGEETV